MANLLTYLICNLFFLISINAENLNKFILSTDNLIKIKAINKIEEIGKEIFTKTETNIYLNIKNRYSNQEIKNIKDKILFLKKYENSILNNLNKPYILITTSILDKHINIIFSNKELEKTVDKNVILNDYILPILVSHDKNSQSSKISAGLLNGYGEIADILAKEKNIELNSTIRSSAEIFAYIWKYFVYGLVLLGIFAYIFAMVKNRKTSI